MGKYTKSILFVGLYQNLKNKNEKKKSWKFYNQIGIIKKIKKKLIFFPQQYWEIPKIYFYSLRIISIPIVSCEWQYLLSWEGSKII